MNRIQMQSKLLFTLGSALRLSVIDYNSIQSHFILFCLHFVYDLQESFLEWFVAVNYLRTETMNVRKSQMLM